MSFVRYLKMQFPMTTTVAGAVAMACGELVPGALLLSVGIVTAYAFAHELSEVVKLADMEPAPL